MTDWLKRRLPWSAPLSLVALSLLLVDGALATGGPLTPHRHIDRRLGSASSARGDSSTNSAEWAIARTRTLR